eukprot:CAMPEP_0172928424 /NCGR_PEP_ID=MMETSP1075-20121228/217970_1 /TAXON_ID=2916 /ORGANISM="Ceratium fusus, Strain PA161109" /LENGTH=60 /DNA_ID=CAMNT_0013789711 /DNA_START=903 /DNA_END=1085 /DNA_ORIENTATION=-
MTDSGVVRKIEARAIDRTSGTTSTADVETDFTNAASSPEGSSAMPHRELVDHGLQFCNAL